MKTTLPAKRGKKQLPVPSQPFPVQVMRDRIIELAGITLEERVRLFKEALKKLESLLGAKETKFFTFKGQLVNQVDVEAQGLQRQAALDLVDILAPAPKIVDKTPSKGEGGVTIVVKKFVMNVADKGPGAPPVIIDAESLVDIEPEPLPQISVSLPDEPQDVVVPDASGSPDQSGSPGKSAPLLDR